MTRASLILLLGLTLSSCSAPGSQPAAGAAPKHDPTVVELGMEAQKNVGLTIVQASQTQLTEYLHVAGTVQPIDSRVGHVSALSTGRLHEILARAGDRVAEGQPLARLDNIEAGDLAAQYLSARADLQKLRIQEAASARQAERSKSLAAIGAISQKELEFAEAERQATLEAIRAQQSVVAGLDAKLKRLGLPEADFQTSSITTIRSPFSGVVIEAHVAPGEVVDSGTELFSVADLSEVWVQAEVSGRDLGRVQVGQPALISVDTYPDERFSGRVSYVSDALDPKTRTARVRCVVANKDWRLKMDMFASVDVPTTFSRKVLAVPAAAVQQVAGKSVVFVRESAERFRARNVQVGRVIDGQAEIVSGLATGDPVVLQGSYHLKAVLLSEELKEE